MTRMQAFPRVTLDPAVMGGKACIRGLRVTVGMIVGLVAAGRSHAEILAAYPYLEEADIREALAYAAERVNEPCSPKSAFSNSDRVEEPAAEYGVDSAQQMMEDAVWVEDNYPALLQTYPEQWIGVRFNQVLAHDPDLDSLVNKLPDAPHTHVRLMTCEKFETLGILG